MIGALVALAVVIFVVANMVGSKAKADEVNAKDQSLADRIAPVGKLVAVQSVVSAAVPTAHAAMSGKAVYQGTCVACHGSGLMNAPKFGSMADWGPRIKQGKPTLYKHALEGYKAMPPKGGNTSLSDAEIKAAIDYMVSQAK